MYFTTGEVKHMDVEMSPTYQQMIKKKKITLLCNVSILKEHFKKKSFAHLSAQEHSVYILSDVCMLHIHLLLPSLPH